jgi:endonuclease/exonuclease/phosphatase family metal-dependent hydrolase
MPVFPKPAFAFDYSVAEEIARLRAHKKARGIPAHRAGRLLVATWNVANLGAQKRRDQDLSLIAEIISWFDLIAVQECREDFTQLQTIRAKLPSSYELLMSDASGNNERMAFVYNRRRLKVLDEIGEIAYPPSKYRSIKLPGVSLKFDGFDRTPYLALFASAGAPFVFTNVHLYYGGSQKVSVNRRALETYAVAKWANLRKRSPISANQELVALGDFNMPKSEPGDPIYNALTELGLELPEHSTQIASSISTDANYDQIAFLPGTTQKAFTGLKGVFDFDGVVFPALWADGTNAADFKAYLRYYLSDHRPMWVQLKTE